MDTDRRQIDVFLQKCDEVMQSKFIIADTKIGELLKAIVTSDLLYAFFRDITKDFDYDAAQRKYMNYYPEGTTNKRKLLFPEDPAERLAFVFCLLVDFDSKRIDLGDFLQEYFYEDGSVYGSFYAFSNQVIKPFRNAVRTMFREPKKRPPAIRHRCACAKPEKASSPARANNSANSRINRQTHSAIKTDSAFSSGMLSASFQSA